MDASTQILSVLENTPLHRVRQFNVETEECNSDDINTTCGFQSLCASDLPKCNIPINLGQEITIKSQQSQPKAKVEKEFYFIIENNQNTDNNQMKYREIDTTLVDKLMESDKVVKHWTQYKNMGLIQLKPIQDPKTNNQTYEIQSFVQLHQKIQED